MKRAFDLLAASAALVALSPLLAVIAIAVKLTSPGPALFRHERIGLAHQPFEVLKFRTMTTGSSGAAITTANDARITNVGAFLRNYKLDELPQLINIVRGEMSIVGPRPEVSRYVELDDRYNIVLTARPGLTDPASLEYRHEQDLLAEQEDPERFYVEELLPEKVRLSVEYVENQSIRRDVGLILDTLKAIAQ